jgi:hypothetical protein
MAYKASVVTVGTTAAELFTSGPAPGYDVLIYSTVQLFVGQRLRSPRRPGTSCRRPAPFRYRRPVPRMTPCTGSRRQAAPRTCCRSSNQTSRAPAPSFAGRAGRALGRSWWCPHSHHRGRPGGRQTKLPARRACSLRSQLGGAGIGPGRAAVREGAAARPGSPPEMRNHGR